MPKYGDSPMRPLYRSTTKRRASAAMSSRRPAQSRRLNRSTYKWSSAMFARDRARGRGGELLTGCSANFARPRFSAAFTPPTVESTSSAISSRE